MKNIFIALLIATTVASCTKESVKSPTATNTTIDGNLQTNAAMKSIDLHNTAILQNQSFGLDLNNDGVNDFTFSGVITPAGALNFNASSTASSMLLTDANSDALVLSKNDAISTFPLSANWLGSASTSLAQYTTPDDGGDPYWEGGWQDMQHKYMGLQVMKNGKLYNGWIELTMDCSNKRLVLHRAAISKAAGANVNAGA